MLNDFSHGLPRANLDDIRWESSYADILTSGHPVVVTAFMRDVVGPSIATLTDQVQSWAESGEPWAPFAQSDARALLKATIESYCLALQSLWERQLRGYLFETARRLNGYESLAEKVRREEWSKLNGHFLTLRRVELKHFDSYPDLDLLHLVANACRHGDGKSAKEVFKRCPEFWPAWTYKPPEPPLPAPHSTLGPKLPSFEHITIPVDALHRFSRAILWFWQDLEYIYINNIQHKHPSATQALDEIRNSRLARMTCSPRIVRN